jgi:hypothetical protein
MEEIVEGERSRVEFVSRVQVRAVVSGLFVAAGVFALCMGLCWAIGLSTFKPTTNYARGLALTNIVWGAIALWIACFFGGLVAAEVGRAKEARSGVLHGLVVWGATAAFLGLLIVMVFGGLAASIFQMSETGGTPTRAFEAVRQAAGLTTWMYWAGIAGGLFTAMFGGLAGSHSESREPKRVVPRPPITPGVPQPSY